MKQSNDDILDELFEESAPNRSYEQSREPTYGRINPQGPSGRDPLDDLMDTPGQRSRNNFSGRKKRRSPLAAVLVLLLAAGLGVFLLHSRKPDPPPQEPQWDLTPDFHTAEDTVLPPLETTPLQIPDDGPADQDFSQLGFYGRRLGQEEQDLYLELLEGVRRYETEIPGLIVRGDPQRIFDVCIAVSQDHAELFWFRGAGQSQYYQHEGYVELILYPEYEFPVAEIPGKIALVENIALPVIDSLRTLPDYEKVKGVYDYLIDHTAYDLNYRGRTIYELFTDGRAVCEGYARAAQYMLDQLDVENIYVTGEAWNELFPRESHAWNIVNVNGDYCQLDVTWGDPLSNDNSQTKNYYYLNVPDENMLVDHVPDSPDLPPCTTNRWSYYVMENRYLTFYDREALKGYIRDAVARGEREIDFQVADSALYDEFIQNLYNKYDAMYLLQEVGAADQVEYFYWNPEHCCITVTW